MTYLLAQKQIIFLSPEKSSQKIRNRKHFLYPFTSMQTLIQSKLNLEQIGKKAWTTSTVLIPDDLLNFYKARTRFFKKRREYLRHLIHTYGRYLDHYDSFPYTQKLKKKHQEKGLGLTDCHFVPNPFDWEELRHLSFAYGPSMCHLFVILVQLEKSRWERAGCPNDFCEKPPIGSMQKIKKKRKTNRRSSKILKKRNSKFQTAKNAQKILESSLNLKFKSILHRSIDFDELELLRIGWIKQ